MNRVKKENTGIAKKRILCIDGGGVLGTFPAAFLAELEKHLDHPIGKYFDLIAGSSTGGIIALGLSMGVSASQLLNFYENRSYEVFGKNNGPFLNFLLRKIRAVKWCFLRKYNSEPLRAVLHDVLGEKRIGEAKTRLLIPAWNPVANSVYIYKTAHHPRLKTDYKSSAVDVAMATSAAPSYFKQHVTQHGVALIDGGIWANNPVAIAVVEAISLLNWPRESLRVLSLGCLQEAYNIPKRAGLGTLNSRIINLFMDGQSQGAMGIAKLLTGHEHERTAIYRVNQTVPYNTYKMDDTKTIQDLKGLGHSEGRSWQPSLEAIFFDKPVEAFKPYYKLED
ncbi:MAG: CBASS cGAMP-activated phospholipase [Candidatus Dadabacteria bacterium]|nr:CBASS cGAMP-activated phospholipase [Candidatus Dadabacteria bacterium]MDE0519891.1 CBASS cGAMP-activated phospholipase [Candidatus Dadabacteria bacterium]MDE0663526.1 CBASS cGAMP-activated phospholipase [Candidatus Dadabacteria bacterium]